MKELVGAFNQENALVGALSVIVRTDGSFAALIMAVRRQEGRWRLYIILRRGMGKVMCPNAA